ncbi:GntP family permease [Corynebacterium sp. A21]|uniref:GntP family permease n=1 Tax=Corynebacterium sp. A21 TaxID=3457318 RepID=UPI003FD16917
MVIPIIGIILSLIFLIGMAYRGHSVVAIAPLAALIAVVFSWDPLLASYTQIFMPALGTFLINFFPLFLAGAIFGRLMAVSGYAEDLARWIPRIFGQKQAVLVTAVITALLTYGGVSAWVIAFTVVPIAKPLFRRANVSMKLMPAAIALGIFTFATAALPGSPQIHNAIPTSYFGTTTFAAPILGIVGAIATFSLGMFWLIWRERSLQRKGEGFVDISSSSIADDAGGDGGGALVKDPLPGSAASAEASLATASDLTARTAASAGKAPLGHVAVEEMSMGEATRRGLIGLLPIIVVVLVNAAYVYLISPRMEYGYLAEERFGATSISAVLGIWSVTVALAAATVLIFLLKPGNFGKYLNSLTEGARNAVLPAFTTASEVGYGAVIASLAVFAVLSNGLFNISDNPLIVGTVATAVISGITGSSSGGLSITLQTFGEQLNSMAQASGIDPEFMHRAVAMASVSFDSLPHNGAIVTLLLVCGLTHRQAYKDIGVVTVLVPFAGLLVIMALGTAVPALV